MSSFSLRPNSPEVEPYAADAPGTLRVELPHWTAQVVVYDNLYQPVARGGELKQTAASPLLHEAEFVLRPGIYKVETSLVGQAGHELVPVRSGCTTTIARDRWASLRLPSAAPFAGTANAREAHTEPAVAWSRTTTWRTAGGGDSRLFLFLRTADPKPTGTFADGLCLLDAAGRLVTDFTDGTERDGQAGWMAFNADLPSGHYLLRRARPGVRQRVQPIFLSAGWETQVFLEATQYPRLHSLALNMAPLGTGFRPDDEAAVAADVLLDGLGHARSDQVAVSDKVAALLEGDANPWLSIVAGYALLTAPDRAGRQGGPDAASRDDGHLLPHVLAVLEQLGDHPDARALLLADDRDAPAPIWCPPLLRVGLRRVQRHATKHVATIPLDSLTDCVLDSLVTNAPWTAWRDLDRRPIFPPELEATSPGQGKRLLKTRRTATRRLVAPSSDVSTTPADVASRRAPVSRLAQIVGFDDEFASLKTTLLQAAGAGAANLREAPLYRLAQGLLRGESLDDLPETIPLDVTGSLSRLLDNIDPQEVTASCGLTLARTERGFARLRERTSGAEARGVTNQSAEQTTLTQTERAIVQVALQKAARSAGAATLPPASDPASSADAAETPPSPPEQATSAATVDECAAKVRVEADRLALVAEDGATELDQEAVRLAGSLADRLARVADDLLKRADFILVTDENGRRLSNNPAFEVLRSPTGDAAGDAAEDAAAGARPETLAVWEAALAGLSPGRATLSAPVDNRISQHWDLQRTVVADESTGEARAYVNVLRRRDAPRLTPGAVAHVASLLPELALYAPLLAYGSPERRREYARKIAAIAEQLEQIA